MTMTTEQYRSLYPPIEPFDTGMLSVSERHTLYYEQCGNPDGKPVVFLHGGPGGGCNSDNRRYFDPATYRIILFDQRGCGRSTPQADITDNTTWHLIADIERLRTQLAIDKWQVFGGSWGSTLALAYAESHPERVTAMVLRGIFMLRREELEWFYQSGAHVLYPDHWEDYVAAIPANERGDMISAFYRRLTDPDPEVHLPAAKAWAKWEAGASFLQQNADYMSIFDDDARALAFARIECHYFVHGGFLEADNQLVRDIDRIRHIPTVIVHGRYDVICPVKNAWDLHRVWPEADIRIVQTAGHSAAEAGNRHELLMATDGFR